MQCRLICLRLENTACNLELNQCGDDTKTDYSVRPITN